MSICPCCTFIQQLYRKTLGVRSQRMHIFTLMGNCGSCWVTRVKAESPQHSMQSRPEEKQANDGGEVALKSSNISKQLGGNRSRHSTSCALRPFTFAELKAATRNFRPDSLLGEGGFGCVFKGWVDEQGFMAARPGTGIVIAVKKLNLEGLQGHKEWLAEVHFLGQLHHPNLVRLIGFCAEDDHRLLVYEFMPRGSLENHLFRRGSHGQALSWAIRIKVAVGAARGLAFLHEAERPVIFRDFKTSNILLNSQFNAKLSDFGLAKDGPTGDNTHVSTRVMGTYGYAAPEYVATGHLTAKSDVYSFGVVLLEILTGRRAVDKNKPYGEQNLVEWARPYLSDKRKVFRIVDPRLEGQYSMKGAYRAATLALSCLNQEAKLRPTMKEVVQLLEPLLNFREVIKHSHHQACAQQQTFGPQPVEFIPRRVPAIQSIRHQQPYPSHIYQKYSMRPCHQRDLAPQYQHGFLQLNCNSSNGPLSLERR